MKKIRKYGFVGNLKEFIFYLKIMTKVEEVEQNILGYKTNTQFLIKLLNGKKVCNTKLDDAINSIKLEGEIQAIDYILSVIEIYKNGGSLE